MHKQILTALMALSLLASIFQVSPPPARVEAAPVEQSGECAGYECVYTSDFNSGTDGWSVGLYTQASWVESMTFSGGALWWSWTSTASGVLKVVNTVSVDANPGSWPDPSIYKTFNLTAGTYRIIYRASYPFTPETHVFADNAHGVTQSASLPNCEYDDPGQRFNQCVEPTFYVDRDTTVTVKMNFPELLPEPLSPSQAAFDYIWVVRQSSYFPTPNPATPTQPFGATPLPEATPRCQPSATPTPTYFGTPTPTPDGETDFALLERFNVSEWSQYWQPSNGLVFQTSPNRGVDTPGFGASVAVTYGDLSNNPGTAPALVFSVASTRTVYLDGYVYAQRIPSGLTATLKVWKYASGSWSSVGTHTVSSGTWYPFGATISGPVEAIAITAGRSDGNTTEYLNVDDLYVYNALKYRPYCNGAFPPGPGGGDIDDTPNPNDPAEQGNNWSILYPDDKPCPPSVRVPNNFWGPILANLTVWFDTIYAESPEYEVGQISPIVAAITPAVTLGVSLVGAFVDLSPLWFVLSVILAVRAFLLVRAAWIWIVTTFKG